MIRALFLSLFLVTLSPLHAASGGKKTGGYTGPNATSSKTSSDDDAEADAPEKAKATPTKKSAHRAKEKSKTDDADEPATPAPAKKKAVKPKAAADDDNAPQPAPPAAETKAATPSPEAGTKSEHAPNATVETSDLAGFSDEPEPVQKLLTAALELTKRNLTYTYGSADPANGGLDCSGTIYYVLRAAGFTEVPRDSSGQYVWARKADTFRAVVSKSAESFEFADLLPGDLLFWSGTYQVQRDVPITHVMLYLGKEKRTGKRIMFGASDGRSYNGVQRWGVSVFDFKMPRTDAGDTAAAKVDFVGYARIPGLRPDEPSRRVESKPAKTEAAPEEESEKPAKSTSAKASPSSKKHRAHD